MSRVHFVAIVSVGVSLVACAGGPKGPRVSKAREPLVAVEQQKLQVPDLAPNDNLGTSVAVLGDTAVLGDPSDDDGPNSEAGSIRVFGRSGSTWSLQQTLLVPSQSCVKAGHSVALTSESAFVGCLPANSSGRGAVHVLSRSSTPWRVVQTIEGPPGDTFAEELAVSGPTLVTGGSGNTAVYTLNDGVWSLQQTIPGRADAVAISGDTLVRGSPSEDIGEHSGQGAAHVFVRSGSTWSEAAVLVASDGQAADAFGSAVALDGDTLVVGAPSAKIDGEPTGAAYVYGRSGESWSERAQLLSSDATPNDAFGIALALNGANLLVGARFHEHQGHNSDHGSAYFFTRSGDTWTEQNELLASDGQNNDFFGTAFGLAGDTVIVGAPNDDDVYQATGSAYAFVVRSVAGEGCGSDAECAPGLVCVGGQCCSDCGGPSGSTCSKDTDCSAGLYCSSSSLCLPQKAQARACEPFAGGDCLENGCRVCASGACVDGFCCDSACNDGCVACARVLTGQPNGLCNRKLASLDPSSGLCSAADPCPGSGGTSGAGGSGATGGSGGATGGSGGTTGGSGAAGGTGGTTGGTGGSGGSGPGGGGIPEGSDCVHVSPDGDDSAALTTLGAVPFSSVQAAVDFASANGPPDVCIAGGADCFASAEYAEGRGDLTLRNGIAVFGNYESTGFTRCSDRTTRLRPTAATGVRFGTDVTSGARLDGIAILTAGGERSTGITVDGALGAEIHGVVIEDGDPTQQTGATRSYGIDLRNGAHATVTESRIVLLSGGVEAVGVSAVVARVDIEATSIEIRGLGGAVAVFLVGANDSHIDGATLVARAPEGIGRAAGVMLLGIGGDVSVTSSSITASGGESETVGVEMENCAGHAHQIADNFVDATSGQGFGQEGAIGIRARFSCPSVITGNTVRSGAGNGRDVAGIACDGGCTVSDNDVAMAYRATQSGTTNTGTGIECTDCAEISSNLVLGLLDVVPCGNACDFNSIGMSVHGSGTLVDSNHVSGGCSGGPTGGLGSIGLRASGEIRVQNNVLLGGYECPTPVGAALTAGLVVEGGAVDVHSNYIEGGTPGTSICTSAAIRLPGPNEALIRNNILLPGGCPLRSYDVDQHTVQALPAVLENNAFAPGDTATILYHVLEGPDADTIEGVNSLSGVATSANFEATCPSTLTPDSACVDAGTVEGAPALDRDGDSRGDGSPDVGADELLGRCSPNPCQRGGTCVEIGQNDHRCECPPGVNGKNCDVVFTQVSSTLGGMCGLRSDQQVTCFGASELDADPPVGTFTTIDTNFNQVCGIDASGAVHCFGWENDVKNPPALPFTAVTVAPSGACGVVFDGSIACWGVPPTNVQPPLGLFESVSLGNIHGCAVRGDQTLQCWLLYDDLPPGQDFGQANPPPGQFLSVRSGLMATCGLRVDGTVACWGAADEDGTPLVPPPGLFLTFDFGYLYGCGIHPDQTLECWGSPPFGLPTTPPAGKFRAVATTGLLPCGVRTDDSVVCWGPWADLVTVPGGLP